MSIERRTLLATHGAKPVFTEGATGVRPAKLPEREGVTIVVVQPDSGEGFENTVHFEELLGSQGLAQ
jgi:hypothetical protein